MQLNKPGGSSLLLLLLFIVSCKQQNLTKRIEGTWNQHCSVGTLSDRLILKEAGVFEQHVVLKDGRTYDFRGTWMAVSPSEIKLNSWANTFRYTADKSLEQMKASENLILDLTNPSVIYPADSKACYYTKPK